MKIKLEKNFKSKLSFGDIESRIKFGWITKKGKTIPPRPFILIKKETYIGLKDKASFVDSDYGEWISVAENVVHGSNHPKRALNNRTNQRTLSIQEVQSRLKLIREDILVDESTYKNAHTKCRLIIGGKEYWTVPNSIFSGEYAFRDLNVSYVSPQKTKLQDLESAIIKKTKNKHKNINFSFQILEEINKQKIKCLLNNEKIVINKNFIIKFGIPGKYLGIKKIPHNKLSLLDIENRIKNGWTTSTGQKIDPRPYISIVGIKDKITDFPISNKIVFFDLKYGEWESAIKDVIYGSGHPERGIEQRNKLNQLSLEEVRNRLKNGYNSKSGKESNSSDYVEIDESTYIDTMHPCRFIDSVYGEFYAKPNHVFFGQQHPKRSQNRSKYEDEIIDWLESLDIKSEPNTKFRNNDKSFELDVYLKDKKIGIDFHGLWWHSELYRDKLYHFRKREFFSALGIEVIQIYSDEWIFKKDLVKSLILNRLGINKLKIYARKTTIKIVPLKEAKNFLELNHLMGSTASSFIGLFDENNTLVSLMGYQLKNNQSVLDITRFCSKMNYNIVGGFSKLLSRIILKNQDKLKRINSWVDLRYATGASLDKLGFINKSVILSWKWTDSNSTFNRLKCRANMDERKLSQLEQAKENGWLKIFDAGQALFVKEIIKVGN